MTGLTVKLPLSFGDEPDYINIKDVKNLVHQNLKNLILTVPGERLMDLNFGVGLKTFLFEPNRESTYGDISAKVEEQVRIYLPFIEIDDIIITPDQFSENLIHIEIQFFIVPTSEEEILMLSIDR